MWDDRCWDECHRDCIPEWLRAWRRLQGATEAACCCQLSQSALIFQSRLDIVVIISIVLKYVLPICICLWIIWKCVFIYILVKRNIHHSINSKRSGNIRINWVLTSYHDISDNIHPFPLHVKTFTWYFDKCRYFSLISSNISPFWKWFLYHLW